MKKNKQYEWLSDSLNQRGITNENDNIGIDAAFVIAIAIAAQHSDAHNKPDKR